MMFGELNESMIRSQEKAPVKEDTEEENSAGDPEEPVDDNVRLDTDE